MKNWLSSKITCLIFIVKIISSFFFIRWALISQQTNISQCNYINVVIAIIHCWYLNNLCSVKTPHTDECIWQGAASAQGCICGPQCISHWRHRGWPRLLYLVWLCFKRYGFSFTDSLSVRTFSIQVFIDGAISSIMYRSHLYQQKPYYTHFAAGFTFCVL